MRDVIRPEWGRDTSSDNYVLLVLFSIFVVALQSGCAFLIYRYLHTWQDRADFGEMFGAINTLFSGLAFAGIIYTISLQRRELELQRFELEMTRKELERSASAQENSERSLKQQATTLVEQAAALKLATRLDTINTLIKLYNEQMPHAEPDDKRELRTKKKRFYEELEEMVDGIL